MHIAKVETQNLNFAKAATNAFPIKVTLTKILEPKDMVLKSELL